MSSLEINSLLTFSTERRLTTILSHFSMTDAKPYGSPMVPGAIYSKKHQIPIDGTPQNVCYYSFVKPPDLSKCKAGTTCAEKRGPRYALAGEIVRTRTADVSLMPTPSLRCVVGKISRSITCPFSFHDLEGRHEAR